MLRLTEKIRGDIARVRGPIREHRDLARSGNRIDSREPVDRLLGQSHEYVSRSYDLIHLRDRFRAMRQRRNRLGTAHLEDDVNTGLLCGYQGVRTHLPAAAGGCHDNLFNTRDLGRHDIHEDRRGIDRLPAGDIDADSSKRRDLLSEQGAVFL